MQHSVQKLDATQRTAVNSGDVQACFFHYSLLLLNDLNILYTFDKLAEVYRFKSRSFSHRGPLELSNEAAHLQY